jgi:hypothetical protein
MEGMGFPENMMSAQGGDDSPVNVSQQNAMF